MAPRDGCGAGLMLEHGLSCKQGRLVGTHHDDVHDEWAHLCSIALTDLQVMIKPTFFYRNGSRAGGNNAMPTAPCTINPNNTLGDEAHGDVLARSFWNHGRGTVCDVCICNTNSRSYGNTSLSKILEQHAKEKKDKYETACLDRHWDFTTLVYSVDGMVSKDVQTPEQQIPWLLMKK